jgi:hypothetical protein
MAAKTKATKKPQGTGKRGQIATDDDTRFFRGEGGTEKTDAVGRARIVDHRSKIKKPGKPG